MCDLRGQEERVEMVRCGQTLRFKAQKEGQQAHGREAGIPGLHEHILV